MNARVAVLARAELGLAVDGEDGGAVLLDVGEPLGGGLRFGEIVDGAVGGVASGEEVPVPIAANQRNEGAEVGPARTRNRCPCSGL